MPRFQRREQRICPFQKFKFRINESMMFFIDFLEIIFNNYNVLGILSGIYFVRSKIFLEI
jgi:hypothetical protein